MTEYKLELTVGESLMCDKCKEHKSAGTFMWFPKWDELEDGTVVFTDLLCDPCKESE